MIEAFLCYDWPGNVRELENAIKRYLILRDSEMTLSALKGPRPRPGVSPRQSLTLKEIAAKAAEQAQREIVLRVLEETHWNRKQAARRLNICYKALLNKLRKWQIDRPNDGNQLQPLDPVIGSGDVK